MDADGQVSVSSNLLFTITRHLPDTLYIVDLTTRRTLFFNHDHFCGYTRREIIIEHALFGAVHPDDRARVFDQWERLTSGSIGDAVHITDYRLRHKLGHWEWIESRALQIDKTTDGSPHRVLVILSIITERKQAQEALEASSMRLEYHSQVLERRIADPTQQFSHNAGHIQSVLSSLGSEVVVLDQRGRIQMHNDAWVRFSARNGNESLDSVLEGVNYLEIGRKAAEQGDTASAEMLAGIEAVLNRQQSDFFYEYPCHSPTERRWYLMRVQPLQGHDGGVVITHEDITPIKLAQEALRVSLTQAQEFSALKSRFVSLISHEYRQPLAVLRTSTDMLRRYQGVMPPERVVEHLERIDQQITHMSELINDVLLYGRLQSGRMEYKPDVHDFAALVREILDDVRLSAGTHHHFSLCSPHPALMARFDRALMRLLVNNLVGNAVKYSPNGGTVKCHLDRDGDGFCFTVEDEGIGIPANDVPHLFDEFFRAANVGDVAGTGLGLALVRQIVDLHGGSIDVDSEEDRGTRIAVYIPSAP